MRFYIIATINFDYEMTNFFLTVELYELIFHVLWHKKTFHIAIDLLAVL